MMRLGVATAQGDGQFPGGCNCNELPVGRLFGVPIKCSIFLVFYCLYSLTSPLASLSSRGQTVPWWFIVGLAVGGLALLFLTILAHEFGHGLTAKRFGGEIIHILLWPLGGLCVHTMPHHRSVREKLSNDWWVTFNGPATHLVMVPCWAVLALTFYRCAGVSYSLGDFGSDLLPWSPGSIARHDVASMGWGLALAIQLCLTAISLNVTLFLFNVLFPMYPMDSSKLLVTGMQLCGTPVEKAAWRFLYISGFAVFVLGALTALAIYRWIIASHNYNRDVEMIGMGLLPIPLGILVGTGLFFWGGKQTHEIYELAQKRRLHRHPLFCHTCFKRVNVRDMDRPDLFVEETVDTYDSDLAPGLAPQQVPSADGRGHYGAVRVVGGNLVRDAPGPSQQPDLFPQQVIVRR